MHPSAEKVNSDHYCTDELEFRGLQVTSLAQMTTRGTASSNTNGSLFKTTVGGAAGTKIHPPLRQVQSLGSTD